MEHLQPPMFYRPTSIAPPHTSDCIQVRYFHQAGRVPAGLCGIREAGGTQGTLRSVAEAQPGGVELHCGTRSAAGCAPAADARQGTQGPSHSSRECATL